MRILCVFGHPVFQVHARDGWDVYGDDSAAEGRIARSPGFGAVFCHFGEDVVGDGGDGGARCGRGPAESG
jgi:hypothetical protein